MNYKFPGLTSILFMFVALAIASYSLFANSFILGAVYTLFIPIALLNTLYNYCRKCPHAVDQTCRHVILGMVIMRSFKPLQPSSYTINEYLRALIPLILLFIYPQYWLIANTNLIVLFWLFMAAAVFIIRIGVCSDCRNANCMFCPKAKNHIRH